jgi:hypothetical protein
MEQRNHLTGSVFFMVIFLSTGAIIPVLGGEK